LRRLAYYSCSPVMKNAFEQISGAPFLARLLFVEIGTSPAGDLFLEVEYDGAINLHSSDASNTPFAVLAATKKSAEQMAEFLRKRFHSGKDLSATLELALDAWPVGQSKTDEAMPGGDGIRRRRSERLGSGTVAAAVLERNANR